MFGDPSGMAPEKHKGGGDVLLASDALYKNLGLYSGTTTASYEVVKHRERVLVGVQRYEIGGRSVNNPDGPVSLALNPLTLEKKQYGYVGVYEMQEVSTVVKIAGGVPSGGLGPGGGGEGGLNAANDNTYTNSWEDVLNSFDLSNVRSDLSSKFTDDLKQMYDAYPSYFEDLEELKAPLKVQIISASSILTDDKKAKGYDGQGAKLTLHPDGTQTLFVAEEYYNGGTSNYNALTRQGYFGSYTSQSGYKFSGPYPKTAWMAVAHELAHLFDFFDLGDSFFDLDETYMEYHADYMKEKMMDAMGMPHVNQGISWWDIWILRWNIGLHKWMQ